MTQVKLRKFFLFFLDTNSDPKEEIIIGSSPEQKGRGSRKIRKIGSHTKNEPT